ncbi:MAG TPA: hypothetical protein VGN32_14190, partial [Ktedonobacterales bacterium]|nr:hypothetical protein [Ktedonobacterales bacterium]
MDLNDADEQLPTGDSSDSTTPPQLTPAREPADTDKPGNLPAAASGNTAPVASTSRRKRKRGRRRT